MPPLVTWTRKQFKAQRPKGSYSAYRSYLAAHRPKTPKRPYTRPGSPPRTQTPTMTGTGVTRASGGGMPGAPATDASGFPDFYNPPKIKNWRTATPEQFAQQMVAAQFDPIQAQEQQWKAMASQQQAAITGYGAELAKILGEKGAGGVAGTLGPDYAAALSMSALRTFAYQQFLKSTEFANEYKEAAAQYPTYLNQLLAQQAEQKRQDAALDYQILTGNRQYGLQLAEMKERGIDMKAQRGLERGRLAVSQGNLTASQKRYQLSIQKEINQVKKWNAEQKSTRMKVDLQLSKGRNRYVNAWGEVIPGMKGKPPPVYAPKGKGAGGKGSGGLTADQRADILDKAGTRAADLWATNEPNYRIENPGAKPIPRPKAYRLVRQYLKLQFRGMKPKQLNRLTENALSAGGYPGAK